MSDGKSTERAADPDQLQREIEETRAELADTLDQIADRVSPKRVADRGVDRVKAVPPQKVAAVAAPVVALLGLLAWRRSRRRKQAEWERRHPLLVELQPALERVGPALERARDEAGRAAGRAEKAARRARR